MRSAPGTLYRAVWRWHFYAGLIVLPVLLWLAATGGLYLYKPEIEAWLYRDWSHVTPAARTVPLSDLITDIEHQSGGKVRQVMQPVAADSSWRMALVMPGGAKRLAFVDPYRARLLGSVAGGGAMATVKDLHSLAITGPIGNALIEIVAGWAIVLVITGAILWWPGRGSPIIALRGRPSGRLFWRDFHAGAGLLGGAVIFFLALTGMPWTGVAGKQLEAWVSAQGLGRPVLTDKGLRPSVDEHAGHEGHEAAATLPWSMQHIAPPAVAASAKPITPDRAVEIAEWSGEQAPWTMTLPAHPGAPFVFSTPTVRAEDAHVVYVAPDGFGVLQDARYADFGAGARWIEWGIATHQGQQYGEPNRLLMLFGCVALWALAITGPVLWWKRRRDGRLRAPPSVDARTLRAMAGAMLLLGIALPLTGLTMLAALIGELGWKRVRAA